MNPSSSRMESQLTGLWVSFFTNAGIPPDVSATYALTFTENRIQNDMLLDLNKEYLQDMGITRMGDVIAILRHAKQVHQNAARDRVLSTTASPKVPVAAVAGRLTSQQAFKPSSPAGRILEHYTRNTTPDTSPTRGQKRKLVETSSADNDNVMKRTRMIRIGKPKAAVVEEVPTKQTVFARLGNSEAAKPAANPAPAFRPILSRLGAKTEPEIAASAIPVPKDALKYEGILKSTPAPTKVVMVTASSNNIRKIAFGTMRADETPVSVKDKLAVPGKSKSVKFNNKVEYKVIENVKSKVTTVFNKPERRLQGVETPVAISSNSGIKARLGSKNNINNFTITKNIFNRLGV